MWGVGAPGPVSFNGCFDEMNGGVAAVFVDVIVFGVVAHDGGVGEGYAGEPDQRSDDSCHV